MDPRRNRFILPAPETQCPRPTGLGRLLLDSIRHPRSPAALTSGLPGGREAAAAVGDALLSPWKAALGRVRETACTSRCPAHPPVYSGTSRSSHPRSARRPRWTSEGDLERGLYPLGRALPFTLLTMLFLFLFSPRDRIKTAKGITETAKATRCFLSSPFKHKHMQQALGICRSGICNRDCVQLQLLEKGPAEWTGIIMVEIYSAHTTCRAESAELYSIISFNPSTAP